MKPQEYITERQKIIDKSVDKLDEALPLIQAEILKRVVNKLDLLETIDGRIKPTSGNLKIINEIVRRDIKAVFLGDNYEDAVLEFVRSFKELGKVTKNYFKKLEDGRPTSDVT